MGVEQKPERHDQPTTPMTREEFAKWLDTPHWQQAQRVTVEVFKSALKALAIADLYAAVLASKFPEIEGDIAETKELLKEFLLKTPIAAGLAYLHRRFNVNQEEELHEAKKKLVETLRGKHPHLLDDENWKSLYELWDIPKDEKDE